MPAHLLAALATLLALLLLTAPAQAQDEQPERSKAVDEVYRDYRDDGVIEACDHTRKTLRKTLDELPSEADVDTPDLRPALEAGIEQHESGDCERQEPDPTPQPTSTPTATPPPASTPTPDTSDDSAAATPPRASGGGGGASSPSPPGAGDVTPLDPSVTPVPPAVTPPAAAVPAPAEPSGPAATPVPVYSNADDGLPASLLVLAGLLALVALLALVYAALSRLGWGEARLAGVRRTWREATFRAGGAWGDFADWIRVGR